MARAIAQGGSNGAAAPTLDIWIPAPEGLFDVGGAAIPPGELVDPTAITFAVFDISTDEKRGHPSQIFPGSGTQAVDLVADRIGVGHYAPAFTLSPTGELGAHEIHYFVQIEPGGPIIRSRVEFDVLAFVGGDGLLGYALISDFRAEGVSLSKHSDERLRRLIGGAKRYIDTVTRRYFEPRGATVRIDGNNTRTLNLREPIIGVASINTVDSLGQMNPIDVTGVRIYSRHLSQRLTQPDDRNAPRIEWITQQPFLVGGSGSYYPAQQYRSGSWPRGTQNIVIAGVFGYTDPDGSLTGCTPDAARRATMLLVWRNLPKLSDVNGRFDAQARHRIKSEKTREQSYELVPGKSGMGAFTGDVEIDDLLEMLCAPMQIESV